VVPLLQKGRVSKNRLTNLLARQILQCVGQIKIGSSAQALYQTPISGGMENPMA
jgi:hypothetical protein